MNYFAEITKEDRKKDRAVKLRDKVYAKYKQAIQMHELSPECRAWREALKVIGNDWQEKAKLAELALAARENQTNKNLNKAAEEWERFVSANPL